MKAVPEHFPFAHLPNANIHSDGSHGSFNERARAWRAHVAFLSAEATNQLSPPTFVDKKEYTDMKKLLEAATGGEYRWSTAMEERARAAPRPSTRQADPAADQHHGVFQQAIAFDVSNINLCLLQQVRVFREWWVVAESRRQLGFIGRVAVSFCREQIVHPQHRRPVATAAQPLLQTIWQRAAQECGPNSNADGAAMRLTPAAAAAHATMDYQIGLIRTDRRSEGYGLRTEVSEEAYKCSLRFFQLRLALAGAVLDEEARAQEAGRREARRNNGDRLREVARLEEVAEVLRACPQPVITHTALHNRLGKYRTRRAETPEDAFHRRQAVLQRVADMGFGQVRRGRRHDELHKAAQSATLLAAAQRLRVDPSTFPARTDEGPEEPVPPLPAMAAGGKGKACVLKRPAAAKTQLQPAQAAQGSERTREARAPAGEAAGEEPWQRVIRSQRARAEDMPLQEQWAALVEWGHERLPKRIHGSGFRVTASRKRWTTRAPRLECLCAGVGDKKGHQPRCNAVYTAEWSSTQHLFTVFE
ncbi:unnamed protein product, partial [Effrenium voratum]